MGDGILDYVTDNWQSLLGMGTAQAADNPPQPATAPPQVMAAAPASFAPNSTFDQNVPGPRPGAPPLSFADRAAPVQQAIKNGTFDQVGGSQTSFAPQPDTPPMMRDVAGNPGGMPGSPLAFAGASPPPVPPPSDSNAAPPATPGGGLATSLGISPQAMRGGDLGAYARAEMAKRLGVSPDALEAAGRERMRRDAMRSTFEGLGKGLTAVGNLRPGATGAAAFAAGAGGSLTGTAEAQKSAQNDLFNQTSTAFKDMLAAEHQKDTHKTSEARAAYWDSLSKMTENGQGKSSNAWQNNPYGRALKLEQDMAREREVAERRLESRAKMFGWDESKYDAELEKLHKQIEADRLEQAKRRGIDPNEWKRGMSKEFPHDFEKLTRQQLESLPADAWVRWKDPKAPGGYRYGHPKGPAAQQQQPQQPMPSPQQAGLLEPDEA